MKLEWLLLHTIVLLMVLCCSGKSIWNSKSLNGDGSSVSRNVNANLPNVPNVPNCVGGNCATFDGNSLWNSNNKIPNQRNVNSASQSSNFNFKNVPNCVGSACQIYDGNNQLSWQTSNQRSNYNIPQLSSSSNLQKVPNCVGSGCAALDGSISWNSNNQISWQNVNQPNLNIAPQSANSNLQNVPNCVGSGCAPFDASTSWNSNNQVLWPKVNQRGYNVPLQSNSLNLRNVPNCVGSACAPFDASTSWNSNNQILWPNSNQRSFNIQPQLGSSNFQNVPNCVGSGCTTFDGSTSWTSNSQVQWPNSFQRNLKIPQQYGSSNSQNVPSCVGSGCTAYDGRSSRNSINPILKQNSYNTKNVNQGTQTGNVNVPNVLNCWGNDCLKLEGAYSWNSNSPITWQNQKNAIFPPQEVANIVSPIQQVENGILPPKEYGHYSTGMEDDNQPHLSHISDGLNYGCSNSTIDGYWNPNNIISWEKGNGRIILTAPHGGSLTFPNVPNRQRFGCLNENGTCFWTPNCQPLNPQKCRSVITSDTNTVPIAKKVYDVLRSMGLSPHLIVNHMHRMQVDVNRPINEAAQGNEISEAVYKCFHGKIREAQKMIKGVGLYLDIHGQSHFENWTEIGYRISQKDLIDGNFSLINSSMRALAERTHVTELNQIIVGPNSFGSILERSGSGYKVVPSSQIPKPDLREGHNYYQGGFNTIEYGSMHRGLIDGMQVEVSIDIRSQAQAIFEQFAADLAITIHTFMKEHKYFDAI